MYRIALALLISYATLSGQSLESLVRACRERPAEARQAAIMRFAASHPRDSQGGMALFALGIIEAENKEFEQAIKHLTAARKRVPQIEDYVSYHLGLSYLRLKDWEAAERELKSVLARAIPSPLAGRAALLAAEAFVERGNAADAVTILRDQYQHLRQPAGNLALAKALEATGELGKAVRYYQRVYYESPSASEASDAAAALSRLETSMGGAYPPPMPQAMVERADRLLAGRDAPRARIEFESLVPRLGGLEKDLCRVRIGAADFEAGRTQAAYDYLRSLEGLSPDADAERLYYLTACARRLQDAEGMHSYVASLDRMYPQSDWRRKALVRAANDYVLDNDVARYEPLFKACYVSFSESPEAWQCHWKVVWAEWMRRGSSATELLAEHVSRYPGSPKVATALYFLARADEENGQFANAQAIYRFVAGHYPNRYYGFLSARRLSEEAVARAQAPAEMPAVLADLASALQDAAPSFAPGTVASARIARSRLLAAAGLSDMAEAGLRFDAHGSSDAPALALELARQATHRSAPESALRHIIGVFPEYLSLPRDRAPREFWRFAFPLPYRRQLQQYARLRNLDEFLLAGLIRQESGFDARAVSRADARGLMQVLPSTGRSLARQTRSGRFRDALLYQPEYNIRLGTYYFRARLDEFQGDIEATLAAYNGGKSRAVVWATWGPFREPAEFIETIPFTETRNYVQIVLANAEMYRWLYGREPAKAAPPEEASPAQPRTATSRKATSSKAAAGKAKPRKPAVKKATPRKGASRKAPPRKRTIHSTRTKRTS